MSHRNGALDGAVAHAAFPYAQYLVSLQLLRGPLRFLFTGIPVIRRRDVERYGMDRSQITDPVHASVDHVLGGGDLVILPEGTSEWRHAPGEYQRGAARIWCRLREAGIDVDVHALGLFYSAPDRFCSLAEIQRSAVLDLPARGHADHETWERSVHQAMSAALDAVSVNCPDPETFDAVQSRAVSRARAGESFAEAFLSEQRDRVPTQSSGEELQTQHAPTAAAPAVSERRSAPPVWPRHLGLCLLWLFAPVLFAAWFAGRKADARNTVSFFRVLGGIGGVALWVLLAAAAVIWAGLAGTGALAAVVMSAGLISAGLGLALLRVRRWQPESAPLSPAPLSPAAHDQSQDASKPTTTESQ